MGGGGGGGARRGVTIYRVLMVCPLYTPESPTTPIKDPELGP